MVTDIGTSLTLPEAVERAPMETVSPAFIIRYIQKSCAEFLGLARLVAT
jgi:hypothetical protein